MQQLKPYIYQKEGWPAFTWDDKALARPLGEVRQALGRLIGRMESLGFALRDEAVLETLTQDVVKTSEIEGENLDQDQVRSSLASKLGMDVSGLPPSDRNIDGVVEMMLDATTRYKDELTHERLFGWHASLFPAGRSNMQKIIVGDYRDDSHGPMQVVSGVYGKQTVYFQ
ncbi:MAG: DUF4172 domain-containing protein, partial [Bacteroidota bacterium]